MPDYQKLYLTLFHGVEQAIDTLIAAQQACEELYMAEEESPQPDAANRPLLGFRSPTSPLGGG